MLVTVTLKESTAQGRRTQFSHTAVKSVSYGNSFYSVYEEEEGVKRCSRYPIDGIYKVQETR
jgi:hypothetical protein